MEKIQNWIDRLAESKYMITLFIVFMILQPVLDIQYLFTDEVINIFKFSPATIIRMIVIIGLFTILALAKKNRKNLRYIIIFGILSVIYTILHIYNCLNINENINPNYRVSVLSEIFYIIRMILPLCVIYISYNYKLSFKKMSIIIVSVILIFSCTVIFTHFTELSLKSYSEKDERITQTVIDWILNPEETIMEESLSKGIFRGANQLGNLLIMLLPIMLYIMIKKTSFINCFTVFVQILACILIGTRIASFSWIIIIICIIIMMFFFSKIKKEIKIDKYVWLILAAIIGINGYLLYKSPTLSRKTDYSDVVEQVQLENNTQSKLEEFNQNISQIEKEEIEKEETEAKLSTEQFIIDNYTEFDIQKVFLYDIYSYKYDAEFWIDIMNKPYDTYNNSRKMQFLIAERIFELNNNPLDKVVGIGFSTTRNGSLYTEMDFYAHYYTLGILGSTLFLYSQLAILLVCILKILLNIKDRLTFNNLVYIMSLVMIFVIALISAHVLDELVVTIFIGFVLGQLLNSSLKNDKQEV